MIGRGEGDREERMWEAEVQGEAGSILKCDIDIYIKYQRESCRVRDFATRGSRNCWDIFKVLFSFFVLIFLMIGSLSIMRRCRRTEVLK